MLTKVNQTTVYKGSLKKLGEAEPVCVHPDHNPPSNLYLEPGQYMYTCPSCGKTFLFTIPNIMY